MFLVPFLKYPSNPPAVGSADTVQERTLLHLTMVAASVFTAAACVQLRGLVAADDRWRRYAAASAVAVYVAVVATVMAVLPGLDEVPTGFPAQALSTFRLSTVGLQAVMWGSIGLVVAALARRALTRRASALR